MPNVLTNFFMRVDRSALIGIPKATYITHKIHVYKQKMPILAPWHQPAQWFF